MTAVVTPSTRRSRVVMAGLIRRCLGHLRRWLKVDLLREAGRQYPLSCCVLSSLLLLTVLLNR